MSPNSRYLLIPLLFLVHPFSSPHLSEGKITLYTAAAGVDPGHCVPVCLDMGTNNKVLLEDPQYKGLRRPRAVGAEFDDLMEEFMAAGSSSRRCPLLKLSQLSHRTFLIHLTFSQLSPFQCSPLDTSLCNSKISETPTLSGTRVAQGQAERKNSATHLIQKPVDSANIKGNCQIRCQSHLLLSPSVLPSGCLSAIAARTAASTTTSRLSVQAQGG